MGDYVILDELMQYVKTTNYKGIKQLLIDEIERDTLTTLDMINNEELEESNINIIINNFKMLKKLATEDYTDDKYIINELNAFGWSIINLAEYEETKRILESVGVINNDK